MPSALAVFRLMAGLMPLDVSVGSRLCENVREPRMPRIVFSFAFFRQKLPVQLVSTATKSRWKFYAQVGRRSFHTAWTHSSHGRARIDGPVVTFRKPES